MEVKLRSKMSHLLKIPHRYDQISTTEADQTGGKEVIEFDAEVESGLSGWPSQIKIVRNAVDFSTISTIDMAEEEENSPDLDISNLNPSFKF